MSASLTTTLTTAASAVSTVGSSIASLSRLSSAGLTAGAESVGDILGAVSMFSDLGNADDWRVRLSLPYWPSFRSSPVLQPLVDAGGLVFPYTPEVSFSTSAKYNQIPTTHSNYQFQAYENSAPGQITITAPMNVEDSTQALYWIASLHYLRSVTKMFSGFDMKAGNPPPVIFLNGYGSYVFKNVPVVVTNFQTSLSKDCDYISCDPKASVMAVAGSLADSIGGLSETLGLSSLSSLTDGLGNLGGILGSFGVGGSTDAGKAHVPTKSTFTVTLQPMYSRSSARKFSLDRFVTGGYVENTFGYI
jgi:hypothetical protein